MRWVKACRYFPCPFSELWGKCFWRTSSERFIGESNLVGRERGRGGERKEKKESDLATGKERRVREEGYFKNEEEEEKDKNKRKRKRTRKKKESERRENCIRGGILQDGRMKENKNYEKNEVDEKRKRK